MTIRATLAAMVTLSTLAAPAAIYAKPHQRITLTLTVKVARCGNKKELVQTKGWLNKHFAGLRKMYAPMGIDIAPRIVGFTPAKCVLITRDDRHALAKHVTMDRTATVLVMKRVQDVDVPTYNLQGVHWRYTGDDKKLRKRRWVYLTSIAKPPVLAHELSHYFGLRHDLAGGNLMTPGPSDPSWKLPEDERPKPWKPLLTTKQQRIVRRWVRRLLRRKPPSASAATATTQAHSRNTARRR